MKESMRQQEREILNTMNTIQVELRAIEREVQRIHNFAILAHIAQEVYSTTQSSSFEDSDMSTKSDVESSSTK